VGPGAWQRRRRCTHWAMSLLRVRTRIMATITVRKTTIMVELVMENQWILSSGLPLRYRSHRCAHRSSDFSHEMSYEKTMSAAASTLW